jgi:hypothetical protein
MTFVRLTPYLLLGATLLYSLIQAWPATLREHLDVRFYFEPHSA